MKLLRFGPKNSLSPTLGAPCTVCDRPLVAGDYTTLMRRMANGVVAPAGSEVHWECAVRVHEREETQP